MITSRHQVQNTLEQVDQLVKFLAARIRVALGPDTAFRFELCLSEALTNIVKHAKPNDRKGLIDVITTDRDDTVLVEIFDPVGTEAFDPRNHATDLENVDSLAEKGRGLGLIMQCADVVDYGRSGDRNRLALQFAKAVVTQAGEEE